MLNPNPNSKSKFRHQNTLHILHTKIWKSVIPEKRMHIWKTFVFPMQKHVFSLMHWIGCWKPCFYMHKNLANQNVTFWRSRLPTSKSWTKDTKLSFSHTNCEIPFKIILCMLKNNVCKTWKRHEKKGGHWLTLWFHCVKIWNLIQKIKDIWISHFYNIKTAPMSSSIFT